MTEQKLFETFYTIIDKGTGKQITDFFNEQFNDAKKNKKDMEFLQKALEKHKKHKMTYEKREMFETFIDIVNEELQKM